MTDGAAAICGQIESTTHTLGVIGDVPEPRQDDAPDEVDATSPDEVTGPHAWINWTQNAVASRGESSGTRMR